MTADMTEQSTRQEDPENESEISKLRKQIVMAKSDLSLSEMNLSVIQESLAGRAKAQTK